MGEKGPGAFENISPEDRERMEGLERQAKKVIAEAEEIPQETVLEEGERILAGEAEKDIELVENALDATLGDPELVAAWFEKLKKEQGWEPSKSRAMVGVLRHALNEVYYRSRFPAPDENDPHPQGESRDTAERILTVVSDDYSVEVMREIEPLVRLYVEKGSELIRESKTPPGGSVGREAAA